MIGGQIIIMFVGGAAFSITRLTGAQWAYSLVLSIISLFAGVLIRRIPFERLARLWPGFNREGSSDIPMIELET